MSGLKVDIDPRVKTVFNNYPPLVRKKLVALRALIIETAEETADIVSIEETLKWGEPSYLVKRGSTVRIDWKPENPEQYAIYFKCTSALVPAFKEIYAETFSFEGNRAIIFKIDESVPTIELKKCIETALRYHKVKHLPKLGMS